MARAWRALLFACAALVLARTPSASAAYDILDCHDQGTVTTTNGVGVAGYRNGRFERSYLSSPTDASCSATTCYVADTGNEGVRAIDLSKNEIVDFASNADRRAGFVDGKALALPDETQALFNAPRGVEYVPTTSAYYAGNVIVADTGNGAIRLIANGDVTTLVSSSAYAPRNVVFDVSDGSVYILSVGTHDVKKLAFGGSALSVFAGSTPTSGFVSSGTPASARFNAPEALAIDSANGKLYVADTGNHAIREIDLSSGGVSTIMGDGTASTSGTVLNQNGLLSTPARLNYPSGIVYVYDSSLSSGVLMVTERGTHQVRRLILTDSTASGAATLTTMAGSHTGTYGFLDNVVGAAALFNNPRGISSIGGGIFYVVDSGNHAIRVVKLESPVDLTFTMLSVASNELSAASHDLVIEEYGAYSVNGPPYNETTSFSGVLTHFGEVHELVMCAYPSVEYFVRFEGAMQATVKDSNNYLYIGYTGKSVEDSLSRTLKLRGPGCTDTSAPNYSPFATSDDGSCVSGIKLLFSVNSTGVVDHAVYELEGPGFYVSESFDSGSGESGYAQSIEIEFVAYPGAVYTGNFYGALGSSLTTVAGQSGLGATLITYWDYNSTDANASSTRRVRIAGPGCTDSSYVNYNQYATASDEVNACTIGVTIRIEVNASSSAASWYDFGSIVSISPALASTLNGTPLENATQEYVAEVSVPPGIYEFMTYGAVSASVEVYNSDGSLTSLATWTGDTPSLQVDEYGFSSTTLYTRKLAYVPSTNGIQIVGGVLNYIGGTMTADDGVSSIVFPEGAVPLRSSVNTTFTKLPISAATASTWWYTWNVNLNSPYALVLTPAAFRLSKSATLSLKYETSLVPSAEGNENLVVVKSADGTTSSAMAIYGATFDKTTGIATFPIDSFGGFSVAFRPTVLSLTPPRGSLDGGDTITIDGVDFSAISTLNTATTYQKCRFGNAFMTATTVASADVRTTLSGSDSSVLGVKLNAVSCPTPTLVYAGYTTVEFHNVENLMSSENGTVFLQTATPNILALAPNEGVVTGGTVVHLSGNFLRAGAVASDWEKYDGDTTFFHNGGPTILSCAFGSTVSRGVAVSSALAIVESPVSASQTLTYLRLGDVDYQRAGYGAYTYIGDIATGFATANTVDSTGEGGIVVSLDAAIDATSKQRIIFDRWRCLFGTISVAARREVDGGYSCVSPTIASGSTVEVRFLGSLGEGSALLGQHSAPAIVSTYTDSVVDVIGDPMAIETLKTIEREPSPLFWEPLKWISTANALVSTPGSVWPGLGQGFGHGSDGIANCTFVTDAGVTTTRVAVIISSALVICEVPAVSSTTAFTVVVSNSIQTTAGSSKTSLVPWFDATTRVHTITTTEFIQGWVPSEVSSSGGVYVVPSGYVAVSPNSRTCNFGVSESNTFSTSSGCLIPRGISPGFINLAIGSSSTRFLDFANQISIIPPARAQKVAPHFVNGDGGVIFEFIGLDLYSPPGSYAPLYCGYRESSTVAPVEYVSSALVKCESMPDSSAYGFRNVALGRRDDFDGALQIEMPASPVQTTFATAVGTFGVQQYSAPTVTSISPSGASARGGMIVVVMGTDFHAAAGGARCAFNSIFVTVAVFNATYAECVSPAAYPMRAYSFSISTFGTAAQRTLDARYRYGNDTAVVFNSI